ncbi:MAG: hypothetical protein HZA28_03980 [Candidatus Omnitrophica bacterium]|nr:hypothetical protein [Candidatus Omnitrophota bacterium]
MNNSGTWIMAGLFFLGVNIKISLLSHSFIFGVSHAQRPIIEFLVYIYLAFLVYWLVLGQLRENRSGRGVKRFNLAWILIIGILARLVYFPSQLIQETDPYRYVWDGQMMLAKQNPYSLTPQEAYESGLLSSDSTKQETIQYVNERINHPGVKTIYPPGAQFLFGLSQMLTPWSLVGWKIMIAVTEILIMFLMVFILKQLRLRPDWVVLYAWSPLIIKEFSNSLHLDVFAVLFICLMIYAFIRKYHRLALLSLAVATMIKWFAIVLLPFLLIMFRQSLLKNLASVGLFAGLIMAFFFPFINTGTGALFEGLFRFSAGWKVNDGLFSVITNIIQNFHLPFDTNTMSRFVVGLIFGLIVIWACQRLLKKRTIFRYLQMSLISLSALFFLIPTGNPWYFTWLFPFLIVFPSRALIAFSGLVFLYYLDFYFMYHEQRELFQWVRLVEYGLFFIILGLELWIKNRQWPLLSRFTMRAVSLERH